MIISLENCRYYYLIIVADVIKKKDYLTILIFFHFTNHEINQNYICLLAISIYLLFYSGMALSCMQTYIFL